MKNEILDYNSNLNAFLFKIYKVDKGYTTAIDSSPACVISEATYNIPSIPSKSAVIEKCGIDRLVEFAFSSAIRELMVDFKQMNQDQLIDLIYSKASQVLAATHKGFISGFKNRIYRKVTFLFPFVRLSLINGHPVITYFFLIEFFSGEFEFWVCEEIPDNEQIKFETTKHLHEYIENFDCNVRDSVFTNSSIYYYFQKQSNNVVYFYYILGNFIMINFGIDISKLNWEGSISLIGKITPNVSRNNKQNIHIGDKVTIIGLPLEKNYLSYRSEAIANLVEANTFRSIYNGFINKVNSSMNKTELEEAQQEVRALYLKYMLKKQSVLLRSDIEIIIDGKTREKINRNRSDIAKLLGDFWGKFTQSFLN